MINSHLSHSSIELKKRAAGDTDGNQNLIDLYSDGTDPDWATNGAVSSMSCGTSN